MNHPIIKAGTPFSDVIDRGGYYADRTKFLRKVIDEKAPRMQIFTRPDGFGKSMMLGMFESFLAMNYDRPGVTPVIETLFEDSWILKKRKSQVEEIKRKQFVLCNMGQYPVISLSLKSVCSRHFEQAYHQLADLLSGLAEQFRFLLDSPRLDGVQKGLLQHMLDPNVLKHPRYHKDLQEVIYNLSFFLFDHFERRPIVLIDDYDVPFMTEVASDDDAGRKTWLNFLRNFFTASLFLNKVMYQAVLMGTLSPKELKLTDKLMRLIPVNTILDTDETFATAFGFTEKEMRAKLKSAGLLKYADGVREHYGVYNFGNHELFCPLDVTAFCEHAAEQKARKEEVEFYDARDDSRYYVNKLIDHFEASTARWFFDLAQGKKLSVKYRTQLNVPDFSCASIDVLWTLLLNNGYLALSLDSSLKPGCKLKMFIPNLRNREFFQRSLLSFVKHSPVYRMYAYAIIKCFLHRYNGEDSYDKIRQLICCLLTYNWAYLKARNYTGDTPAISISRYMIPRILRFMGFRRMYRKYDYPVKNEDWEPEVIFFSKHRRTAVFIKMMGADDYDQIERLTDDAIQKILNSGFVEKYLQRKQVMSVNTVNVFGIGFWNFQTDLRAISVKVRKVKNQDGEVTLKLVASKDKVAQTSDQGKNSENA